MNTPADLFRRRRSKVDALQAKFAAATAELERMDGTDMSERMQEVNLLLPLPPSVSSISLEGLQG